MVAQPTAQRSDSKERAPIAGEAFLRALADHGVEYLFANPGTDFPPVVEAYSRAKISNHKVPTPLVIPHENLAMAMAHGSYAMTGKPAAVMLHVNVGTANAISNLINMSRDYVPVLLCAGRTPITEKGKFGGRNRYIHWGQEMFDQAAMLREIVKWDYELRLPEQTADVVSRACEITMTSPRGPVYLSLPREPLSAPLPEPIGPVKPRAVPAPPHPDPAQIATLAEWIAASEKPLFIATASGAAAIGPLGRIAEKYALPVVTQRQREVCLPSNHPMHMGYDSHALIPDADLIVILDADVPWVPNDQQPNPNARFASLGEDPNFRRYPMRSFPNDLSIMSNTAAGLAALEQALSKLSIPEARIAARRTRAAEFNRKRKEALAKASAVPANDKINFAYLSRLVGECIGEDAIVFNEYSLMQEHIERTKPNTFYGNSAAAGLGWGFGAALGAKLAAPDKLIVATLGDGAHMFSNPMVSHWTADIHKLPILTIIFNNSLYAAVRGATMSMFKDGVAGQDGGRFMADLSPSPAFELAVQAQGGHGVRVEKASELPAALARARDVVVKEGRQALVNVICPT
ncbi:MAG: thiamine pyrophosphate-requiring protein [Alphaproteobacteria bacterium]|nr:thiamine pyrophosphate-requiring protein [Alphaproteobacteria bacterium]